MGNIVFVAADPSVRMRFKRARCPVEETKLNSIGMHSAMILRCDQEIMVFFKNVALCPVHGFVLTTEPWTEGEGGQI